MKWGLAVLAFAIRLTVIAIAGFDRVDFGDARDYLDTASALCTTGAYPDQGSLPFFRAPGLPFFIAITTLCEPQRVAWVKIALALVDSATVALIVLLSQGTARGAGDDANDRPSPGPSGHPLPASGARGNRRCPSPRLRGEGGPERSEGPDEGRVIRSGSVWAGLAAALYPLFIVSTTDVRTEPLFMFLIVLALYGLQRRKPALSGVSLALAALTRPVALIFVPLFALRRPRTFLLAFVLVLAPWTIRNYVRYGEFILVNNAGGYSLWRGTHPEMARIYSIRDREQYRRATIEFEQRYANRVVQGLTPRASSAAWRNAALANIRAFPRIEALFTLKKAWLYWRPWLNPQEYSFRVVVASGIVTTALYVLALLGFARMERRVVLWIAAFFVVGWLAHLPHQMVMRFRYPLTDPILIIAASLAIPPRIARLRTSTPRQPVQTEPDEIPKTAHPVR